jgi:hypothetical protein
MAEQQGAPLLLKSHDGRPTAHRPAKIFWLSRGSWPRAQQHMRIGKNTVPLVARLGLVACVLVLQACLSKITLLQSVDAGPIAAGAGGSGPSVVLGPFDGPNNDPSSDASPVVPSPLSPVPPMGCLNGGVCELVDGRSIDKVDLLFVIDNTSSMADAQARLIEQMPRLLSWLTSGQRFDGDPNVFPPVKDLHVGVVSTDMGASGVKGLSGCDANGGDDGRLQHAPHGAACDAAYPSFLSYPSVTGSTNLEQFAADIGCVARMGTQGCRFEQPLEAALKAVWPSVFVDSRSNVVTPNPIFFLSSTAQGMLGRGDIPASQDGSIGFLRNDKFTGLSLIAIVVLSDEDDCSMRTSDIVRPQDQLLPSSPYYNQELDLRCHHNKSALYDVVNRYAKAFRLLRQGDEQLVVFAAIAGVPVDLVDGVARAGVDFTDAFQRNAYYAGMLADARMQEEIEPGSVPGASKLRASCSRADAQGQLSLAYPPRRLVELARAMGDNGVVQSICQDDLGLGAIVETIGQHLGAGCLETPLQRSAKGLVTCDVIWELPPPGAAPFFTPTDCSEAKFLKPVTAPRKATNDRKGNNCLVAQLPVLDAAAGIAPAGEGWYYDDFDDAALYRELCRSKARQRIAFSPGAQPPVGVNVVLDCKASARAP